MRKAGQMENGNYDIASSQEHLRPTIDKPATYCIQVVGHLDCSWSARLGGLQIITKGGDRKTAITTLTGPLSDQAALFGVLKALYDLRMPLLSVECLGDR